MFLNDIANALTASEVKKKAAQSRNSLVKESISGLRPGSDVVITGPVEFEGATGVLDSFSPSGEFVVVNLYNHGKKSFQRSDVSYNDYADSDQEEADMYDQDEDFRRSRSHDVDEDSWTDGQNAWSSDKNLWSESAEGGVFNVGDQVTYKGQPAEVIAVDGTAATVYVANWRAVPGMMDDTTEMDPASKFLTPLEQGVAENNDDDDHGYMPTNLKLGAYRDEWDPRDYSAYPDEFKSNEGLREIVYNMVEEGVEPTLEVVSPRVLTATQDWLADDRYRDDGSVFEEYEDHPVVLKLNGEAYILDGHHRCSRALTANRMVRVYMFVAPQGMAEAGYAGADDTDTVGFHLDTERAYQAIMSRYGDMIDQDETSGIMYVPARLWPKIEMIAFDADGIGALRDDDLENPEHYGIAEAKHQPRWEVEQRTAGHHNAFYIVRGYDRPRDLWKDARGMSDFKSRAAAEAKAAELNSSAKPGVTETSPEKASRYLAAVIDQQTDKLGGIRPDMFGKIEKTFGPKGKQRKAGVGRAMDRMMKPGKVDEVTGDLPFDTMLSKIVAGGNLQTLAAKIVDKIKKFPQYRMPGEDDRDEFDWPNGYPDGHFFGDDLWIDDSFDSIMKKWKSLGPDKFADENGELSFKPSLESSNDYTNYWNGVLELLRQLESIPGAVEQLAKMVWHGLFSGSVEQGITDIGRKGVAEGYKFKGGFPFDVDHMSGAVHKQDLDTKKKFTDEELWLNTVNKLNSSLYDDNSDYISSGNGYRVEIMGKVWAKWDGVKDAGWIETSPLAEGAKVDRMIKHIEKSEEKAGKSKKDAESIAYATANKRGMLDNKNKKKHVAEAERNEMDTPAVQKALKNMSDRHKNEKWTKEQLAALGKKLARPVKESYWDKLQAERSTKLNSLVTELSEAIKGKE